MKAARLLRMVTAVVPLLVSGCSRNASAPSPQTGQVQVAGVVRDFRSDAAVAGAHVAFSNITTGTFTSATDSSGAYSLMVPVPRDHEYSVSVDSEVVTSVTLKDRIYRGDLYAHGQGCEAQYGMVIDSQTRFPVFGANVSLDNGRFTTTTDRAGWFRVSLGCDNGVPFPGCLGYNTTFATVTHPDYSTGLFSVGRGICFVERVDWELQPRAF